MVLVFSIAKKIYSIPSSSGVFRFTVVRHHDLNIFNPSKNPSKNLVVGRVSSYLFLGVPWPVLRALSISSRALSLVGLNIPARLFARWNDLLEPNTRLVDGKEIANKLTEIDTSNETQSATQQYSTRKWNNTDIPIGFKEERELVAIELILGINDIHGQQTLAHFALAHFKDLVLFFSLHNSRKQCETISSAHCNNEFQVSYLLAQKV